MIRLRSGDCASDERKEVMTMPRTGDKATQSGIYANDCHRRQIALSQGETFPPCAHCHRAANWTLIRATR
jgi:hypothetical protein